MRTRRGEANSHIVDVHFRESTAQRRCCMQQVVQLSSTARMRTPRGGANSHIVDVHFRASTEALHRGGVACSMQVVQLSSTACTAALLVTTECTPCSETCMGAVVSPAGNCICLSVCGQVAKQAGTQSQAAQPVCFECSRLQAG